MVHGLIFAEDFFGEDFFEAMSVRVCKRFCANCCSKVIRSEMLVKSSGKQVWQLKKFSSSGERLQMIFCGWIHHFGIACSNGCG
jgi:hypothetical protein